MTGPILVAGLACYSVSFCELLITQCADARQRIREKGRDLAGEAWEAPRATLRMWTRIVGKIRLAFSPPVNHWWHVPLYADATIRRRAASYHKTLSEFLLSYNDVGSAASPSAALLDFCESTAAATLRHWDRVELERNGARRWVHHRLPRESGRRYIRSVQPDCHPDRKRGG